MDDPPLDLSLFISLQSMEVCLSAILQPTHRQIEQHQRMAGGTTRTSRTTDCRRQDAGNTTGGAALASAHPRLHPRLDRARRGGWDEHCVHDDSIPFGVSCKISDFRGTLGSLEKFESWITKEEIDTKYKELERFAKNWYRKNTTFVYKKKKWTTLVHGRLRYWVILLFVRHPAACGGWTLE